MKLVLRFECWQFIMARVRYEQVLYVPIIMYRAKSVSVLENSEREREKQPIELMIIEHHGHRVRFH